MAEGRKLEYSPEYSYPPGSYAAVQELVGLQEGSHWPSTKTGTFMMLEKVKNALITLNSLGP